jgi:glycosyltransferase involved in cell wall biosynthesis
VTGDGTTRTTVVLPVWDEYVTSWLERALESLRSQDPEPQIMVVDNASEVEIPALSGIEVVRSPRRLTRGAARDLGLAKVETPYVVMWDADDLLLPGTLSFLEQAISSDPGLVAFSMAVIEEPSGARHRWPRRWALALVRWPRLFAMLHCMWSTFPTTGATIMRTEAVRSASGYGDAEAGEDWFLGVSLAFRGRFGWSERPGRVYRIHGRSNWARHATDLHYQLSHARAVRQRIRADAGIPRWARLALPLIQFGQYGAIAVHVGLMAARRVRSARGRDGATTTS